MIRLKASRLLAPLPRVSSREWLPHHVSMPKGTESSGLPFSLQLFPHVDGVIDAFDDVKVRRIVLQWGTRLGKTTTCLSLMAKVAGTNPRNMMFASSTKEAAGRVVGSRLYPILESTEGVKNQLPIAVRRSKLHVKLESCQIFVGWSGSDTSLADVGAYFGCANEIDKWTENASTEADSLKLFINRFKGFPDHKIIFESTPTIKGRSRIEKQMAESNQHRRYVPCPHCGEFQILRKGDEHTPGGIKWERGSNGHSNADIAFQTAYYECKKCLGRIENHHRVPMLRRGVWCPDGSHIDIDGTVVGRSHKEGSDAVGFGPLASWYALTETWGAFPRLWIQAQKRPRDLQDVVNGYMGETWEVRKSKSTPEMVGERLRTDSPRGVVPKWGRFVTVTIDRQAADGGFAKWVVLAHGEAERSALIAFGEMQTLEEVWEKVVRNPWPCADGGLPMTALITAIDSGWDTKRTYEFCNSHIGAIACKGTSTDIKVSYKLAMLEDGITDEDQPLFHVNTDFWETEIQCCLDERLPGEPGSLSIFHEASYSIELLTELCNAMLADVLDKRGNARLLWVKKEESHPNDYRDAIRYGKALGKMWVESQGLPVRHVMQPVSKAVPEIEPAFVRAPEHSQSGGWIRRRSR